MFFGNLTLTQFLLLLGAGSAVIVALYLLDRSRRRQLVSTLRFWISAQRAPETRRRRRIQQWPSLLLQMLSLTLLVSALGQLSCGSRGPAPRDHVLILDTSAWTGARTANGTLLEQAQALARACLRALPPRDRVMLVRADALATPATAFTSDRQALERAIAESRPGATALRLEQALAMAMRVQRLRGAAAGEIIFLGAGRMPQPQATGGPPAPPNLRWLAVDAGLENCGLRRIGLARSPEEPAVWNVYVAVRNYGQRAQRRRLVLDFGGAPVGSEEFSLPPAQELSATFSLRTRAAGWLQVQLSGEDALAADDRALLELPSLRLIHVIAYSSQPELLRPLLGTNPWVRAEYRKPEEYDPAAPADVVILDRYKPPVPPRAHAIWIEPPPEASPVAVRSGLSRGSLLRWRADHPVAAGIRTQDLRLEGAVVLAPAAGDVAIAETDAGPVIVARPGSSKTVVFGFHPARSSLRYELAAPLLIANILRWMAPAAFRRWEVHAASPGTLSVELAQDDAGEVRVVTEDGRNVPFTADERGLKFFWAEPGLIRVLTPGSELVYSLTLPEVAEVRWQPPDHVRRGLPSRAISETRAFELWPWLALAGGLCLLAEWQLYGRSRTAALRRKAGRRWLPNWRARPARTPAARGRP